MMMKPDDCKDPDHRLRTSHAVLICNLAYIICVAMLYQSTVTHLTQCACYSWAQFILPASVNFPAHIPIFHLPFTQIIRIYSFESSWLVLFPYFLALYRLRYLLINLFIPVFAYNNTPTTH